MTLDIEKNRRTYIPDECVVIYKTKDKWGEFSNMCGGFPLTISHDIQVRTLEHLYQALKHPNSPSLQQRILEQPSPLIAKRVAYEALPHPRFSEMSIRVMRHLLSIKFCQHTAILFRDLVTTASTSSLPKILDSFKQWKSKRLYRKHNPTMAYDTL